MRSELASQERSDEAIRRKYGRSLRLARNDGWVAAMPDPATNRDLLASMSPDALRTAMRSARLSHPGDLAAAIGVSRSTVSLWLEGKVGVPRPVAMLLRMLVAAQRRAY